MHGVGDVCRGIDALDLDSHHPRSPDVGRLIEDRPQFGVDGLAGRQGIVEVHVTDHVPQVGLGQLRGGHDEVANVVRKLLGVGRLVVDDRVDRDNDVVLRDDLLGWDVDDLLTHVDLLHLVDERHNHVEPGIKGGLAIAPEPFRETLFVLLDDLDRQRHIDDQRKNQNDDDHCH